MLELIGEVVELVREQRQYQTPTAPPLLHLTFEAPMENIVMKFKRSGPSPFEGTMNLDKAEAFVTMKCNAKEKLRFGIYML